MKEFIEKLIGRMEEERKRWTDNIDFLEQTQKYQDRRIEVAKSQGYSGAYFNAIEIVNELAEEYINTSTDTSTDTSSGWIEKLLEAKENCSEDSRCSECPFGQIEDRCILAELQIKGGNNGWIPCSERLPSEAGKYLITVKNLTGYWILDNNVFVCDYQFDDFIFQGWEDNAVIAWMPLPAPYKEGVTENE